MSAVENNPTFSSYSKRILAMATVVVLQKSSIRITNGIIFVSLVGPASDAVESVIAS